MDPHEILRAAQIQMETLPDGGVALTFPKVPAHPAVLVGLVVLLYLFAAAALVGEDIVSWNWRFMTLSTLALAVISAPLPSLFSRCAGPFRIAVNREGVSVPGGLFRFGIRRRLRLDRIQEVTTHIAGDLIGRAAEVTLQTQSSGVLAAHRLSYPAALAVQYILETAIKERVGKAT